MNPPSYYVRWMIPRDVPDVVEIDTGNVGAWSADHFLETLRIRECIGMVVEPRDRALGFMVYELRNKSLRLLRLGVDAQYRRCGVGTALIDKLKYKVLSHRRKFITLDAPEALTPFHLFLKAQNFLASAVTPDGYRFTYIPTADEYRQFGRDPLEVA